MDTEHSTKSAALPSKLRWRPYSNGTSIKARKAKESSENQQQQRKQGQDINPKAIAHKVRGKQYYAGKTHNPPVEVKLQWEEAETIESMSHGGHPHNQHHPHSQYGTPAGSTSRASSTGASSSSTSERAASSLPSPPPSAKLALVGGESNFGQYKASLPDLDLPLSSIASNTSYQFALNALLENHRKQAMWNSSTSSAGTPTTASPASTLLNPTSPYNQSQQTTARRLSTSDLLGIATIDELLASCGYVDAAGGQSNPSTHMLASPATTNQSLHASPINALLDAHSSRGSSPSASFSPFDYLNNTALSAQMDQNQADGSSPTLSSASTTTDTYGSYTQELSSPFAYLAAHGDPLLNNAPSAWPSLFPSTAEEVGNTANTFARSETATQTDTSLSSARSPSPPTSGFTSTQNTPPAHLFTEEGLDPEWLSYLDEASPLFSDVDMPSLPLQSPLAATVPDPLGTSSAAASRTENAGVPPSDTAAPSPEKSMWNWAEDYLKPAAAAPVGHRGFPSAGSFGRFDQLGGGGLVRTFQARNPQQQRSGFHTRAGPGRGGHSLARTTHPGSSSLGSSKMAPSTVAKAVDSDASDGKTSKIQDKDVIAPSPASTPTATLPTLTRKEASSKVAKSPGEVKGEVKDESTDGLRGLLARFRRLWKGGDDNEEKS